MNTAPEIKLSLYHAWEAPLTVILRHGPTRMARLILWNRDDNSIEAGQWLRLRVYPERCGVSADGRHFIYAAYDTRGRAETFTAISRPPWFTALAFWWVWISGGSGRFIDARRYVTEVPEDQPDLIGRADGLERVFQRKPSGKNTLGYVHADGRRVNLSAASRAMLAGPQPFVPDGLDCETDGGRLIRDGRLVADFSDMAFEPLRAPYDWRPPPGDGADDPPPWHPLDGEDR